MRGRQQSDPNAFRDNATSCAICLENFPAPPTLPAGPGSGGANPGGGSQEVRRRVGGRAGDVDASTSPQSVRPGSTASSGWAPAGTSAAPLSLQCGHKFCEACISEWMRHNNTCPVCRQPAGVDVETAQSASSAGHSGDRSTGSSSSLWRRCASASLECIAYA